MASTISAHLAKDACTRLPVEIAKQTAQRSAPMFRKYWPTVRNADLVLSRPQISPSIANLKLAESLDRVARLNQVIEDDLPNLNKRLYVEISKKTREAKNIAQINDWIYRVQGETHKLVSCHRVYLGQRVAQLLIDVVWYTPENPRHKRLAFQIKKLIEMEDRPAGWPGKWTLLSLYINLARTYIPNTPQPPPMLAGQLRPGLPPIPPRYRQATLDRALDLIMEANLLPMITRAEAKCKFSERLIKDATSAIQRLELINERIRLTSLVEESTMDILELDSGVRAAGVMFEAALWLGSETVRHSDNSSKKNILALFDRI
ncbi:hypothetical protein O1611_g4807 [Lasiodiplodia mahajangana]|uniref:Uncharacterized protein n=1 Tax=Lasiodiplodia mahajangana TaxID=1108764 RepID=A0ACC2JNA0_9PEZI|nr:hypothetical protein O1611_g4807 [Lasiodiplodia mahajangana]